jgi:hypothetical protein
MVTCGHRIVIVVRGRAREMNKEGLCRGLWRLLCRGPPPPSVGDAKIEEGPVVLGCSAQWLLGMRK